MSLRFFLAFHSVSIESCKIKKENFEFDFKWLCKRLKIKIYNAFLHLGRKFVIKIYVTVLLIVMYFTVMVLCIHESVSFKTRFIQQISFFEITKSDNFDPLFSLTIPLVFVECPDFIKAEICILQIAVVVRCKFSKSVDW